MVVCKMRVRVKNGLLHKLGRFSITTVTSWHQEQRKPHTHFQNIIIYYHLCKTCKQEQLQFTKRLKDTFKRSVLWQVTAT